MLTCDQAVAFIAKAHKLGQPELALGQALQFEGTLWHIDIIGEWLPDPERPSGLRWANGLLWQDIKEYVLQKGTTKTGAEAAIDFREYPLALAELRRVPSGERVGPGIVDSRTGLPFKTGMYAKRWRLVARAGGIPENVWTATVAPVVSPRDRTPVPISSTCGITHRTHRCRQRPDIAGRR